MRDFPEGDQQIQNAQTRHRAAKPRRGNRRLNHGQSCFLRDERKQKIIAPIAERADAHPRKQDQNNAQLQAENDKENNGQFCNHKKLSIKKADSQTYRFARLDLYFGFAKKIIGLFLLFNQLKGLIASG